MSFPRRRSCAENSALSPEDLAADLLNLEAAASVARQDSAHAGLTRFQDETLDEPLPPLGEIMYARPFAAFKNHYPVWADGEQKWFAECAVEESVLDLGAVSRQRGDRPVGVPPDPRARRAGRTRRGAGGLFAGNPACPPRVPAAHPARPHRRLVRLQQLLRLRRRTRASGRASIRRFTGSPAAPRRCHD